MPLQMAFADQVLQPATGRHVAVIRVVEAAAAPQQPGPGRPQVELAPAPFRADRLAGPADALPYRPTPHAAMRLPTEPFADEPQLAELEPGVEGHRPGIEPVVA